MVASVCGHLASVVMVKEGALSAELHYGFCFLLFFPSGSTCFWLVRRTSASVTFLPPKLPHISQGFEESCYIWSCQNLGLRPPFEGGTDVSGRGFGLALLSFEKSLLQF